MTTNNSRRLLNLNADLGESFGAWRMGRDEAMLDVVNSANVACGFHAGDPLVMRRTVIEAAKRGVSLGAHPSFPDLQGFGRRRMEIPPAELEAMLIYQIGALAALARAEGQRIAHVKPHGALNNMACADIELARCVARAVRACDEGLILLAPVRSKLVEAGQEAGLTVVEEIFADRAYLPDGNLVPRSQPGAVLHDPDDCVRHVMGIVESGAITAIDGQRLPVQAQSVCVHGDNDHAVQTARAVRGALEGAGYGLVGIEALQTRG
jgi:5-oxoprolinase (ATP-hydrolysing) subunit A